MIAHYLEAIYYIWAEGEVVRSARLADWLSVSRPTVTVALRRMVRDGMVRLNAHKEIELTARGDAAAAAIVRRHRIVERWMTDVLGLDWVAADAEAERLEHAVSEVVEERLYRTLGGPKTCPHGNPIPGHSTMRANELRLSALGPVTPGPSRGSQRWRNERHRPCCNTFTSGACTPERGSRSKKSTRSAERCGFGRPAS